MCYKHCRFIFLFGEPSGKGGCSSRRSVCLEKSLSFHEVLVRAGHPPQSPQSWEDIPQPLAFLHRAAYSAVEPAHGEQPPPVSTERPAWPFFPPAFISLAALCSECGLADLPVFLEGSCLSHAGCFIRAVFFCSYGGFFCQHQAKGKVPRKPFACSYG